MNVPANAERLAITATYYDTVTGELDKAVQTYQQMIDTYQPDAAWCDNLGTDFAVLGRYENAMKITQQAVHLAPDRVSSHVNLASYALAEQRFDEARKVIREAQVENLDDYILHDELYALAFLGSDSAAMAEQQQWLTGKPEFENFGLALLSDTEAYGGHLSRARELTRRAVDSAIRADSKENGAVWEANASLQEAAYGDATEARDIATEALKLAPASHGVEAEAALAFAMAGAAERAESLVRDLGERLPLDTQMQSLWLPGIHAQLALDKNNPADALSALQAATAIEFGVIPFLNSVSCLNPVYVRGEAYLAAGQGMLLPPSFRR